MNGRAACRRARRASLARGSACATRRPARGRRPCVRAQGGTARASAGEQCPVVLGMLREPEPRVEDDQRRVHALRHDRVDPAAQFMAHLRDHVGIDGPLLHPVAMSPPVHDDIRDTCPSDQPGHVGVGQAAADVVDQPGARVQRGLCHLGPHGVHADRDALAGQPGDHGYHPAQFLGGRYPLRAGAGRLAAHVNDVRALLGRVAATPGDGHLGAEPFAPVREGSPGVTFTTPMTRHRPGSGAAPAGSAHRGAQIPQARHCPGAAPPPAAGLARPHRSP